MRVVVAGGAGYIGGHVARALARAGHEVHVVDDLSNGHAESVHGLPLTVGDVTAPGFLQEICDGAEAQAILHFAARIQVGESVARPDLYYQTNVGGMMRVGAVALARRIPVVFSSTAAVYGEPESTPIPTTHPCRPENPYGWSKWMGERILADCARAGGFSYAVLRYFNAAGGDVAAGCGERHAPETHLVPLAIDAARKGDPPLQLFGDDWPTPDGTCVRDYVHVSDLADAHVRALEVIARGAAPLCLNLGGGQGTTVKEVLTAVGEVVGRAVPFRVAPRRAGDVAQLVADIGEARRVLDWTPSRSSIRQIVADAAALR
jgi:UDP-glucose-4-epimerase GalE